MSLQWGSLQHLCSIQYVLHAAARVFGNCNKLLFHISLLSGIWNMINTDIQMSILCTRHYGVFVCQNTKVFVQNTTSICMKYQKYFCWHCITSQSNQQGNSAKRNTKGICVLEYQSICVKYKKSICKNAKKYLCVEIVLQVATQSRRQLGQTACRCRAIQRLTSTLRALHYTFSALISIKHVKIPVLSSTAVHCHLKANLYSACAEQCTIFST